MRRARRSNWKQKERAQQREWLRRWKPVLEAGRMITQVIAREQRTQFMRSSGTDFRKFGDRSVDALSRARRALDEAIRYGRR